MRSFQRRLAFEDFHKTSQQLLDMYPGTTDKEREYLITKKYKTVFIMQIGADVIARTIAKKDLYLIDMAKSLCQSALAKTIQICR